MGIMAIRQAQLVNRADVFLTFAVEPFDID